MHAASFGHRRTCAPCIHLSYGAKVSGQGFWHYAARGRAGARAQPRRLRGDESSEHPFVVEFTLVGENMGVRVRGDSEVPLPDMLTDPGPRDAAQVIE